MYSSLLSPQYDIHSGGDDLQFPHHENEIAQSEEATGEKFVNVWMHNGFVRVDDEKMSKSLGNFFTIREVLECYDCEVIRFFILRAHYRSPLNYSDHSLDEAKTALTRLYTALKGAPRSSGEVDWAEPHAVRFKAAMDDDFNTPEAMAVLFDLASEANRGSRDAQRQLRALGRVLGLLERDAQEFLQGGGEVDWSVERIQAMIAERAEAKRQRDFAKADGIRATLSAAGIVLEDTKSGTTWRRV